MAGYCRPVVVTTTGAVRGVAQDGILRFLGIPYAEPPLGALRFRPTVPRCPWQGIRDADRFGPASLQVFDPAEGDLSEFLDPGETFDAGSGAVGSEDSLTLNVWTPGTEGARAVLVYIHGGANWLESSRLQVYSGDRLATEDLVVFSLNYRLGVFGFLDLSVLGPDAPRGAAAHGLLDQLTALRWIAANAGAFGGDARAITIVGESAGAMDLSWLLGSGMLGGIARRAVMMSGVASVAGVGRDGTASVHDAAEGGRRAGAFLAALGIGSFPELQALDGRTLIARHARHAARSDILFDMDTLFYPRVEGWLDRDPFAAVAAGALDGIDLLIGFMEYEMGLWLAWDDALDRRSPADYVARLPFLPPRARDTATALYAAALPEASEGERGMHLLGDAMFVMPSLWYATLAARRGCRVHAYVFGKAGADPRRGALHAADQAFFFGHVDSPSARLLLGPADAAEAISRHALSSAMLRSLAAFAREGDPAMSDFADWPRFDDRAAIWRIDTRSSQPVIDAYGPRRRWWFDLYEGDR